MAAEGGFRKKKSPDYWKLKDVYWETIMHKNVKGYGNTLSTISGNIISTNSSWQPLISLSHHRQEKQINRNWSIGFWQFCLQLNQIFKQIPVSFDFTLIAYDATVGMGHDRFKSIC